MKNNKILLIVWKDAHSEQTWMHESEITAEPYLVTTIGFRLRKTKKGHTSLAQSITPDGNLDHVIHIPDEMIVSVQELI